MPPRMATPAAAPWAPSGPQGRRTSAIMLSQVHQQRGRKWNDRNSSVWDAGRQAALGGEVRRPCSAGLLTPVDASCAWGARLAFWKDRALVKGAHAAFGVCTEFTDPRL